MPSTEPERANHVQLVQYTLINTAPTKHKPATKHKKRTFVNAKRNSALRGRGGTSVTHRV